MLKSRLNQNMQFINENALNDLQLDEVEKVVDTLNKISIFGDDKELKEYRNQIALLSDAVKVADNRVETLLRSDTVSNIDLNILQYCKVKWMIYDRGLSKHFAEHFPDKKETISKLKDICNEIANKTSFAQFTTPQPVAFLEAGVKSRLWKAILAVLNSEDVNEKVKSITELKSYCGSVIEYGVSTDVLEHELWVSKLIECEMHMNIGNFSVSQNLIEEYFGETFAKMNIESEETDENIVSAIAHQTLVRVLVAQRKYVKAIPIAEKLASFGDKFTFGDDRDDVMAVRNRLYVDAMIFGGMNEEALEHEKTLAAMYPKRLFS